MKAALQPLTWGITCPCCGESIEIERVEDDDAGVFHGADEWCAVECPACRTFIEVVGVIITEHDEPPWQAPRG